MNQKIKQLIDNLDHTLMDDMDPSTQYREEALIKMVADECMKIAQLYDAGTRDDVDRCARHIATEIKKTFGL